jgi:hypothetical protein
MRATLAVPAEKPDEIRRESVARKNQAANKAPEPTPGLVTSRAEMASEMVIVTKGTPRAKSRRGSSLTLAKRRPRDAKLTG